MTNRRESWRETFTAFAESLLEVLRAELAVVTEAWQKSFRELAIALGLLAVAGYVALVLLPPLLIFAMVFGLHTGLGWPLWGAALTVAGLVTLILALVAWLAFKRLRERCENPVATVKERVADNRAWWNDRIVNDGRGLEEDNDRAGEANGSSDREDGPAGEPTPGV